MKYKLSKEYNTIEPYYNELFPENERMDLHILKQREGSALYLFFNENQLCGFIMLLTYLKITHILYLGVLKPYQNKGIGSKILYTIQELYPTQIIIADLEKINKQRSNYLQRIQRANFYLKNNFRPSKVQYTWQQDDYVIYEWNGCITQEEFRNFWKHY